MANAIEEHLKTLREADKKRIENSPEAKEARELASNPIELTRYRNERNLMLFPFCSTSKRKRLKTIEYRSSDGKRWLQVSASHQFGMAKIWDFDILRFALSKAGEIKHQLGYFPSFVEFTIYECLKAIDRDPKSGKNIMWFREAIKRLVSTTYIGNIFREDVKTELAFTLIKYQLTESVVGCGFDKIKMSFDERLIESVRYQNGLLAINKQILHEESGIKKRLLELIAVSKGNREEWSVSLSRLQEMCAHEGELKKFKKMLYSYNLPWEVSFSKAVGGRDKVTFISKASNLNKIDGAP